MNEETIGIIVIAVIVMAIFGLFKKKRQQTITKIVVVKEGDTVDVETGSQAPEKKASVFKRILTFFVSIMAGVAVSGAIITVFVEPEIGPVSPESPLSLGLFVVSSFIIYAVIRGLSSD